MHTCVYVYVYMHRNHIDMIWPGNQEQQLRCGLHFPACSGVLSCAGKISHTTLVSLYWLDSEIDL